MEFLLTFVFLLFFFFVKLPNASVQDYPSFPKRKQSKINNIPAMK